MDAEPTVCCVYAKEGKRAEEIVAESFSVFLRSQMETRFEKAGQNAGPV